MLCKHCTLSRNVTHLDGLPKIIMIQVEMYDAGGYYAMIDAEVQIQAVLLDNLQSVSNMEKAMAGDSKDDFFP